MCSPEIAQKVHDVQAEMPDLQVFVIPPLDDMIHGYTIDYPYKENFDDVRWNPVLILHSSGSTGTSFLPMQRPRLHADTVVRAA